MNKKELLGRIITDLETLCTALEFEEVKLKRASAQMDLLYEFIARTSEEDKIRIFSIPEVSKMYKEVNEKYPEITLEQFLAQKEKSKLPYVPNLDELEEPKRLTFTECVEASKSDPTLTFKRPNMKRPLCLSWDSVTGKVNFYIVYPPDEENKEYRFRKIKHMFVDDIVANDWEISTFLPR